MQMRVSIDNTFAVERGLTIAFKYEINGRGPKTKSWGISHVTSKSFDK